MDEPHSLSQDTEIRSRFLQSNGKIRGTNNRNINVDESEVQSAEVLSSTNCSPDTLEKTKFVRDFIWSDLAERIRGNLIKQFDEHLKVQLDQLIDSATSRENNLKDLNWKNDWMTDKHKNDDAGTPSERLPIKQYRQRDSVLTTLFELSHIRTVYNIFVAVLIIYSVNTIIQDLIGADNTVYTFNLDILKFAFGKLGDVFSLWLVMKTCTIFVPFLGFLMWFNQRPNGTKISIIDWVGLVIYVCYQISFCVLPVKYILKYDLPPASTMIIVSEQIRMLMKSHAFIRTSVGIVFGGPNKYKLSTSTNISTTNTINDVEIKETHQEKQHTREQQKLKKCVGFPHFSHYLYFLFAPTVVYRDSYPTSSTINWNFVATNIFQVIGCFIFSYYIFVRFCFSQFSTFGQTNNFTFRHFVLASTACTLPGGLLMLIAFYAFLHSWLNAFAEMLRFGDRLFYKDWWNSTTLSVFYRTWNVIIHDWLYTYVYRDILMITHSRAIAATVVFWFSATVHEYALMLCLRFCLPVLFTFFAGGGVILFFVRGSGRAWNVLIWLMLFTGWGQMMCLYSMEWYARKNCPPIYDSWFNFFVPHLLFCSQSNMNSSNALH